MPDTPFGTQQGNGGVEDVVFRFIHKKGDGCGAIAFLYFSGRTNRPFDLGHTMEFYCLAICPASQNVRELGPRCGILVGHVKLHGHAREQIITNRDTVGLFATHRNSSLPF